MRSGWKRPAPLLTPDHATVETMVRAALPRTRVAAFAYADGGFANTNLRVDLGDRPVLLRLYQHDPRQAAKEAAAIRMVEQTVPVARVLHSGTHDGQRFAVVEWIEGERLEVALRSMDAAQRHTAGESIGTALAAIHRFTYPQMGFLDDRMQLAMPLPGGAQALIGFLKTAFVDGKARTMIGPELADAAMRHAEDNAYLTWPGLPCLVHGDFNGSNILMRGTEIAAVIDWEFAISATPDADFGNLQRNNRDPDFLAGVVAGYTAEGQPLPDNWRKLARLSDLIAWADILNRPNMPDSVAVAARKAIGETVTLG